MEQDARISPERVAQNSRVIYSLKVSGAVIAGVGAGISGALGWTGLLWFTLSHILLLAFIYQRFSPIRLYLPSTSLLLQEGLFHSVMSFVLFWTLLYDIAYVF